MISIIIPTLNEECSLPSLLEASRQQAVEHEVIVVDGGSRDRTLEVARDHNVRTLVTPPVAASRCVSAHVQPAATYCCSFTRTAFCYQKHWAKSATCFRPIRMSSVGIFGSFSMATSPSVDGSQGSAVDKVHRRILRRLRDIRPSLGVRGSRRFVRITG